MSEQEYNYEKELETIIEGYKELTGVISCATNGRLQIFNLMKKLNEQLDDHYSTLIGDLRMHEKLTEHLREELAKQPAQVV